MICPPCRSGGILNNMGRYDEAKAAHDQCAYPKSCTCQHATGGNHHVQAVDQKPA